MDKIHKLIGNATFYGCDKNILRDKNDNVCVWMPTNATKFHKFITRLKYGWNKYKYNWE